MPHGVFLKQAILRPRITSHTDHAVVGKIAQEESQREETMSVRYWELCNSGSFVIHGVSVRVVIQAIALTLLRISCRSHTISLGAQVVILRDISINWHA